MIHLRYILFAFFVLPHIVTGCSNGNPKDNPKTLILTLAHSENSFAVLDYEIADRAFKDAPQQGLYQTHFVNELSDIIKKISFDDSQAFPIKTKDQEADLYLSIPILPKIYRVNLYKLDISSGHYQLKKDAPLLSWTVPKKIRKKVDEKNEE